MGKDERKKFRVQLMAGLLGVGVAFGASASAGGNNINSSINQQNTRIEQESNMTNQEFINNILPYAKKASEKTHLYISVIIATACLESSFGRSILATEYNNFFWLETNKEWSGEVVVLETPHRSGKKTNYKFKKFETFQDSIDDYANYISRLQGVQDAINCYDENRGGIAQAKELAKVQMYVEAPIYEDRLIEIIDEYGLLQYDTQEQEQAQYPDR